MKSKNKKNASFHEKNKAPCYDDILSAESAEIDNMKNQYEAKKRVFKVKEALTPYKREGSKFITYDKTNSTYKIRIPKDLRTDSRSKITAKSEQEAYDKFYTYLYGENPATISSLYEKVIDLKQSDPDISSQTIDRYNQLWNKYYAGSEISDRSIKELKASELKTFFKDICSGRSISRKNFNNIKTIMNMIYDFAVENDLTRDNLSRSLNCKDLKFKAVDNSNDRYTNEERLAILDVLASILNKSAYLFAIELMFCLCIRIGELKALRWSDVNFRDKTINISREIVLRKGPDGKNHPVELPHTKGGEHGARILPLSERALSILYCLRNQPIVYEHIACTQQGNPLNTGHFNDHLKDVTAKAGVPYRSSHKIRFWSVSELARATGGDLQTVMYAAGHVDKNTTLHYIRAVKKDTQFDAIRSCFG
ncbi:tyrosine-type recombinase/integrase [Butyrivibrio sp. LC3010]|uniref:tyrosine-type recombinase/integrase n=1 Tax=Butyrivibrio sp. LC3010 TaxID=1280680 RepID=UPI0003FC52AC|nr:tyrosine-type recombinase/integrase [Butyrivibrio sp. LC3010]